MDVGMVFAMIFTAIVIVFLLTGGMKMIMDLLGFGESAQIEAQIRGLGNTVSKEVYWLPIGGSKPFEFALTSGTDRVCFLDYLDPRANPAKGWEGNNVIEYQVRQENYTIYYFFKNGDENGYPVERARVMESFCISSSQDIMLTSRGRYVEISPTESQA